MKHSQYDIQRLHTQSQGLRTFLLFIVLGLIVAVAVYGAIKYWKMTIKVEPEPPRSTRPVR